MSYYLFEYLTLNPQSRQDKKARKLFYAQIQLLEENDLHALLSIIIHHNYYKICSRPKLFNALNNAWKTSGHTHSVHDIRIDTKLNDLLLKISSNKVRNQKLSFLIDHSVSMKRMDSMVQAEYILNTMTTLSYNQRKFLSSLISGTFNNKELLPPLEKWISNKYNINKYAIKYFIYNFTNKILDTKWEDIIELIDKIDRQFLPSYIIKPIQDKTSDKFIDHFQFPDQSLVLELISSKNQTIVWKSDGDLFQDKSGMIQNSFRQFPEGRYLIAKDQEHDLAQIIAYNGLSIVSNDKLIALLNSNSTALTPAKTIQESQPAQGTYMLKTNDYQTFFKHDGKVESYYFPLLYVKGRRSIESIVLGIYHDDLLVPFCEFDISDLHTDFIQSIEEIANQFTTERFGPVRQLKTVKTIRCKCSALRVNNRKKSGFTPENAVLIQDIKPTADVQCPDINTLLTALPVFRD